MHRLSGGMRLLQMAHFAIPVFRVWISELSLHRICHSKTRLTMIIDCHFSYRTATLFDTASLWIPIHSVSLINVAAMWFVCVCVLQTGKIFKSGLEVAELLLTPLIEKWGFMEARLSKICHIFIYNEIIASIFFNLHSQCNVRDFRDLLTLCAIWKLVFYSSKGLMGSCLIVMNNFEQIKLL